MLSLRSVCLFLMVAFTSLWSVAQADDYADFLVAYQSLEDARDNMNDAFYYASERVSDHNSLYNYVRSEWFNHIWTHQLDTPPYTYDDTELDELGSDGVMQELAFEFSSTPSSDNKNRFEFDSSHNLSRLYNGFYPYTDLDELDSLLAETEAVLSDCSDAIQFHPYLTTYTANCYATQARVDAQTSEYEDISDALIVIYGGLQDFLFDESEAYYYYVNNL